MDVKNDVKNALGKAAAAAREKNALSLRAVAKKANISAQAVYDVEHGAAGLATSVTVLRALGVPKGTIRSLVVWDVVHDLQLA